MMKESLEPRTARSENSRIVFAVSIQAHFPEMYRTACGMLRRGRFAPIILFTGDDDFAYERGLCNEAGLSYIVDPGTKKLGHFLGYRPTTDSIGNVGSQIPFISDASSGTRQCLKRLPMVGPLFMKARYIYMRCVTKKVAFISLPWHLNRLRRLRQSARAIIQTAQPDVVVIPHVSLGGILGCIAIEAKRHGIPVAEIPYTWIFRDEIIKALTGKSDYQTSGLINRWVSKRYPQWLFRGYLSLPPVRIVALEWLGFPTTNPWMADNIADAIALDSEVMLRSYVADGVPAHKCRVTGSASHDILALAASRTTDIDSSGNSKSNKPNIEMPFALSFLPPDQTGLQMEGFEYPSYRDMLFFWIETVTAHDTIPTIFSLHPRMKGLLSALSARFPKINIYDGDACELIPHAKFCVGQFGGMMRYALACAKPILYYDVFNYRISGDAFTSASSVITVNGRMEFAATYARFATDKAYLSVLERNARVNAPEWGKIDGCAAERIEALLAAQCLQPNSLSSTQLPIFKT